MPTFAERLRELRASAGLTQAEFAERSGLPIGSIRGYEQGQREPFWHILYVLVDALGVSPEAFRGCSSHNAKPAPKKLPRRSKK